MELIFRDQIEASVGINKAIEQLQDKAIQKGKVSFFVLITLKRVEDKIICNISPFKSIDENVYKLLGCWMTVKEIYYCPVIGGWKHTLHFQTFQEEICAHICSLSDSEYEQMMLDAKSDVERKTIEDSRGLVNNGIFS